MTSQASLRLSPLSVNNIHIHLILSLQNWLPFPVTEKPSLIKSIFSFFFPSFLRQSHYVVLAGLELTVCAGWPFTYSLLLPPEAGLKVCTIIPSESIFSGYPSRISFLLFPLNTWHQIPYFIRQLLYLASQIISLFASPYLDCSISKGKSTAGQ